MSGKTRIILAFCASMLLLIFLGGYAFRSTNQYKSASDWVTHTQRVISEAEVILREVQGIESAQRGYVITGNTQFIKGFNADVVTVESTCQTLKNLVSDNKTQGLLLASICNKVTRKINFAKSVVKMRAEKGFEPAQTYIATGIGEDLMVAIKSETRKFISHEEKLLSQRLETANQSYSFARGVIISAIIFTIVVVFVTMIFFINDYNIRRDAEDKLKAANTLAEESVMLKEAFLANMSHEIRTPMNAIIGFTDLLLKRDLKDPEKDYVNTIRTSGENLLRIINDVLDVSKMESGMMNFETHPLSIKQLFSSLRTMLDQKAKDKNLALSFSFDPNVPDVLLGDPTRLTQILINLIGNSIKFTNRGRIEIFAKVIDKSDAKCVVEFIVRDTGIGIHQDKLDKVFERFIQAESHTARHYGGTGLGLSIVKQLVELQGGNIAIESTIDVGTTFSFTLPFLNAKEEISMDHKATRTKTGIDLKLKKILLVEDNLVNVKYMVGMLGNHMVIPDIAENGKIAVEKVKANTYDVILMDIEMPEMNGYDATKVIRNDLKSRVPIIAMTAHAMAGEQEKCLELGMNGYISKPVREHILLEKLFEIPISDKAYTNTANSERLINLEFLNRSMRGRKNVIRETIDITLQQLPEDMERIREGFQKKDMELVRRFVHRMKSTVSLMGMHKFELLLEEFELAATKGEKTDKINALYESFMKTYQQAVEEIKAERSNYI